MTRQHAAPNPVRWNGAVSDHIETNSNNRFLIAARLFPKYQERSEIKTRLSAVRRVPHEPGPADAFISVKTCALSIFH